MPKPSSPPKPSFRMATAHELAHIPDLRTPGRPRLEDFYGKILVQIVTPGTIREAKPMFVTFDDDATKPPIDQAWAEHIAESAFRDNGTIIHEVICYGVVEEMGVHAKAIQ